MKWIVALSVASVLAASAFGVAACAASSKTAPPAVTPSPWPAAAPQPNPAPAAIATPPATPPAPGKAPLGPFFELETSSPALDLLPTQRYTHVHRTFHLVGPDPEVDRIARATIKVGLDELVNAFSARR